MVKQDGDWTKKEDAIDRPKRRNAANKTFEDHEVNPATFINRDQTEFKALGLSLKFPRNPLTKSS